MTTLRRATIATCTFALMFGTLLAVPGADGAFVQDGSILSGATFSGWSQAGASSVLDGTPDDHNKQDADDIRRFWSAFATANGGSEVASPSNPMTHWYLRIDHSGDKQHKSGKMAIQLNLGAATQGKVDHLLQFEASGPNEVEVLLMSYDTPYPDLGAFTTGSVQDAFSNQAGSAFKAGVVARTGLWDASHYGVELGLPIAWLTDSSTSQLRADGSGVDFVSGAVFSASGGIGGVGTPKDVLRDGAGATLAITASATTGSTTYQPATAKQLAFVGQPMDAAAGASLGTIRVEVQDAGGAKVSSASHEVTLTIATDPSGGTAVLAGTRTVAAVAGTATFHGLSIDTPGTGYTLRASAAALSVATSAAFTVTPPPSVTVAPDPVDLAGNPVAGSRWGGWTADPGAATVTTTNFLKVVNSGPVDATTFTVDFTPSSFSGSTDPTWSIGLDSNAAFACAETQAGQPPAALAFTYGAPSTTGSVDCSFTAGSANGVGTMYVAYRLSSIPATVLDQPYAASFTVTVAP